MVLAVFQKVFHRSWNNFWHICTQFVHVSFQTISILIIFHGKIFFHDQQLTDMFKNQGQKLSEKNQQVKPK